MQLELTLQKSALRVESPAQENRRPVRVRKPAVLRGPDGKIAQVLRRTPQELEEDFWKRVKIGGFDECWEWQAGRNDKPPANYGVVWLNGTKSKTHVFSFELVRGPIPKGMHICHRCDNPPCCNPLHLFMGTHKDNMMDKIAKGRGNLEKGEDRYNARLTEEDVREIRRRHKKGDKTNGQAALAKEFGVYYTMIHSIVHFRRWKHVT